MNTYLDVDVDVQCGSIQFHESHKSQEYMVGTLGVIGVQVWRS